jgi:hypothetical protein
VLKYSSVDITTPQTKTASAEETHFLNVDVDLRSKSDLEPLVNALGKKVVALHVGREGRHYVAHLELARQTRTADSTIRALCSLIRALKGPESRLWKSAVSRDFNIGVQSGTHPHSYELALTANTIREASELDARIVFTVYAPIT